MLVPQGPRVPSDSHLQSLLAVPDSCILISKNGSPQSASFAGRKEDADIRMNSLLVNSKYTHDTDHGMPNGIHTAVNSCYPLGSEHVNANITAQLRNNAIITTRPFDARATTLAVRIEAADRSRHSHVLAELI